MKKVTCAVLVALSVAISLASFAFAEDACPEKVSGFVDFRNDFVSTKDGDHSTVQWFNVFVKQGQIGTLLETNRRSNHLLTVKPSVVASSGRWSALFGFSTNSARADYIQAGIWFADSFGKLRFCADMRNYFSISDEANGYTDNFFQVMYPLGKKLSIGTEACYDHWWKDGHNFLLVGERLNYQINKKVIIYGRVSHDWTFNHSGTAESNCYRVGVTSPF